MMMKVLMARDNSYRLGNTDDVKTNLKTRTITGKIIGSSSLRNATEISSSPSAFELATGAASFIGGGWLYWSAHFYQHIQENSKTMRARNTWNYKIQSPRKTLDRRTVEMLVTFCKSVTVQKKLKKWQLHNYSRLECNANSLLINK